MVTVTKYANVVNPQINPNLTKRNGWYYIRNAVGHTNNYAVSSYSKKSTTTGKGKNKKTTTTYNYPYKVNANEFKFNIPSDAYIKKIKFEVYMKTDTNGTGSTFPELGFYIKDRKSAVSDGKNGKTGWHNGIYWVYSNRKLSKTWTVETYVMDEATYNKGGFTVANLNSDYFGVDLSFADSCNSQDIYLRWVRCTIDYDVPTYSLTHNYTNNTRNNPAQLVTGVSKKIVYNLKQTTKCKGGTHTIFFDIDYGTELVSASCTKGSFSNNQWTVNCDGVTDAYLTLEIIDYTVNDQNIIATEDYTFSPVIPDCIFYYHTVLGWIDDYTDNLTIQYASTHKPHKRHTSCFKTSLRGVSSVDDELELLISNDKAFDLVGRVKEDNTYEYIELGEGTSGSVSIKSTNLSNFTPNNDGSLQIPANTNIELVLNVPTSSSWEDWFDVVFNLCLRPKSTGANNFTVNHPSMERTFPYTVENPYVYHIGSTVNETDTEQHERLLGEMIKFTNHRIASNLETGAFVLPCRVKEGDALMLEGDADIHMYKWEAIDYIGCVPVEHHHFDPKSTYKDTLLDNHYKNKRYMGKQLAPDEDITLNIRLHPRQVTTIQGLIDMDKPIPVNANHKCFEGDALNHRGWCEIYSIKAEETNPHWYKCDIDVKYLTHNLNTRFHINQGDRTFNYTIPSLLAEIQSTGDAISDDQSNDFFIVDTDGTYAYIPDEGGWETYYDYNGNSITWLGDDHSYTLYVMGSDEETAVAETYTTGSQLLVRLEELGETIDTPVLNQTLKCYEQHNIPSLLKNRFSLDEGQHISIKSRNPLSTINEITFGWLSSRLTENKENNISRVFRLIDAKTKDVVFEYEYCDFDFTGYTTYQSVVDDSLNGILSCRVIGRVKNQGDFDTVIDEQINLVVDIESGESYTDEDTQQTITTSDYFGSTLHFRINNNILAVIDEGYNSKEVEKDEIKLEGNQYYYESYWVNKNTDGEDADIISYFDIVVQDSILETTFADKYSSMYISPFPVTDKKILFTRKAEEGVIYYLEDNKEEFTYLIEPYYQYHNGVDLRASVDDDTGDYISIFNLNYGYKVIYLENGLVSLGINRLNGKMYLRKYDPILKDYVTLFNLHLNKYDDININSISDDRIELQASDSTIIMYRGHPYVIFKHELEDIGIDSKFNKVYGQSVDGNNSDYPVIFDLMNHDNLLPPCVTSKLDDDCVSLSEHTVEGLTPITIAVTPVTGTVYEGDTITLTATGQPMGSKVHFLIKKDDDDGFDEVGSTTTGSFNYKFDSTGAYQVMAVYVGDDTYEYSISEPINVDVGAKLTQSEIEELIEDNEQYEEYIDTVSGNYELSISSPSTFTYRDGQTVTFTLTKGGVPVKGRVIQMVDFKAMNTATTNDQGQVSFSNTRANTHPDTYEIGARFYASDDNSRLVTKVFKKVTVKKATPEFILNHRASTINNYFSVKLKQGNYNLSSKKVNITVNGNKNERTTNSNGNASVKITKKGIKKYSCTFNGDKDYKKCSFTYREKVVNG